MNGEERRRHIKIRDSAVYQTLQKKPGSCPVGSNTKLIASLRLLSFLRLCRLGLSNIMATEIPLYRESAEPLSTDPIDRIIRYHVQTKHHFNRYARALGYLDWANQPDPFRRFEGAPLVSLPLLKPDEDPDRPPMTPSITLGWLPASLSSCGSLSRFFEFALALSAWKKAGESEWALRSNPSSGNLHPTEGYFVLPQIEGIDLKPGLYHYAPKEHGLELRAEFSPEHLARLLAPFPPGAFLFGLTSVHWREAWKYGERAFRYCNHDVGHAIGSARIAAATLGWKMALLDGASQETVALLLGTNRVNDFAEVEPEHPDCLAVMWHLEDVRGEALGVRGREERDPTVSRSRNGERACRRTMAWQG